MCAVPEECGRRTRPCGSCMMHESALPCEAEFLEDHLGNGLSEPHCGAEAHRRELIARREGERGGWVADQGDRGRADESRGIDDEGEPDAAAASVEAGRKAEDDRPA